MEMNADQHAQAVAEYDRQQKAAAQTYARRLYELRTATPEEKTRGRAAARIAYSIAARPTGWTEEPEAADLYPAQVYAVQTNTPPTPESHGEAVKEAEQVTVMMQGQTFETFGPAILYVSFPTIAGAENPAGREPPEILGSLSGTEFEERLQRHYNTARTKNLKSYCSKAARPYLTAIQIIAHAATAAEEALVHF